MKIFLTFLLAIGVVLHAIGCSMVEDDAKKKRAYFYEHWIQNIILSSFYYHVLFQYCLKGEIQNGRDYW